MNPSSLFDRLDEWRHLPSYQLERRADIFFSLYLHEALEAHLGTELDERLVPELPLAHRVFGPPVSKAARPPKKPSAKSWKVDYAAVARDRSRLFLVELKTDQSSNRRDQDLRLERASQIGARVVLEGALIAACDSKPHSRAKHAALFRLLERLRLLELPEGLETRRVWASKLQRARVVVDAPIQVVYVQPRKHPTADTIDFETFARVVDGHDDPWSRRFARSLRDWASRPAGAQDDVTP